MKEFFYIGLVKRKVAFFTHAVLFAIMVFSLPALSQTNETYYSSLPGSNGSSSVLIQVPEKYLVEFPDSVDSALQTAGFPGTRVGGRYYLVTDTTIAANYSSTYYIFPTYSARHNFPENDSRS